MHLSPVAAVATGFLAVAQARIYGIAVPATIRPGEGFNAVIHSSNYIQSVFDVAITFGFAAGEGYPDSLGVVTDSFCLGKGTVFRSPARRQRAQG